MKKLTSLQLCMLLICGRAFTLMTFLPAGSDNSLIYMIGTVVSTLIQAAIVIPIIIFQQKFQNENPCTLALSRSKPLGIFVTLLYMLYFALVIFYVIGTFTYFMDYYFSDYIPRIMIVISSAAAAVYVGKMNTGVIGKTGAVVFALFLFFTATLVISSLENFSTVNFHLADNDVSGGIWQAAKGELSRNADLIFLVFLLPDLKGKVGKSSAVFLAVRFALVEIIMGFVTIILGDYTMYSKLPFFSLAAYSKTSIIERYDAAIMSVWVMLAIIKLGMYVHCTARCVKYTLPKLSFVTSAIIASAVPAAASLFYLIPHKWETIAYSSVSSIPLIILAAVVPLLMILFMRGRKNEKA